MKKGVFIGALIGLGVAGAASAQTLTFEGNTNVIYDAPINRSGFTIGNLPGDEQHFHELLPSVYPTEAVSNGTGVLFEDRDSSIFIASANGIPTFTLGNFDYSNVLVTNTAPSVTLEVSGFLNGVLTGSFTLIPLTSFATANGASLGLIDQVVFNGVGGGGGFELDNVALTSASSVAAPGPIAGAGLIPLAGVAAAWFARRRKRLAA